MAPTRTISVLIAVYNAEKTLADALRSITSQTRPADEIVIVDDGSTDKSSEIINSFEQQHAFRVIRMPENSGFTYAINAGLQACRSTWIARLDADDWWNSDHLEVLESNLDRAKNPVSLVATRARYWSRTHQAGFSPGAMSGARLRCYMMHDNPFVHSAVAFNRLSAQQLGGYPVNKRWEDYGLWINLLNDENAIICDSVTVNCTKAADSLSSIDKSTALKGRLVMQYRAWRLFRKNCPVTGTFRLATTLIRVLYHSLVQRLVPPA